ncbi:MAG: aldo/keto reductase, partial [Gammaproteobacteria bacterium]|nr:aldo/keto reductase [Gammaproteobacteria bacterium]
AGGLRAIDRVDVLMLTYNRADTSQAEVIEAAHKAGKGVLIKKGLASGHALKGHSVSAAETFRFLLQPPGVSSIIVGTINPSHLRENIAAVEAVPAAAA